MRLLADDAWYADQDPELLIEIVELLYGPYSPTLVNKLRNLPTKKLDIVRQLAMMTVRELAIRNTL